jgi:isopentenyl diphosphate isomerase/L-lactate dehydrogenase-like FMN-dependent dehydrogenase
LKALAIGAKAVAVARPYLYGLAAFGQRGVERVIELLKTELALDMGLAGVPTLSSIDPSLVRFRGDSL